MKTLVWTDGSCNANGIRGRGGWAARIEQAGTVRELSGCADGTTQNRMEVTAVCEALETLTGAIEVFTDSPYVEKCFNENLHERWLRDGAWRGSSGPIKNRDLWERLFGLVWDGKRDVRFVRIKGHAGDPNNERVDRLAREAALSGAVCAPDVEATLAFDGDPGSRPTVLDGFAATTGPPLDPARGAEAARKLKSLGVKGVLVKAAELGYITQVTCKMAECFCPEELGGARYFEPLAELGDWTPTHHYFPLSKRDGGRKTVDNALLAHRLCNRIDYSISVGQSYEKDLAKVRKAREAAAGS